MSNPYRDWETSPKDDQSETAPPVPARDKKGGWGCFVYGCLGVIAVVVLTIILLAVGAYLFARSQIKQYTAEAPIVVPAVEVDEQRVKQISERIDQFAAVVDESRRTESDQAEAEQAENPDTGDRAANQPEADPASPRELVLTAEEINLLIASEPKLRGRLYVTISDGQVLGKISMPTDMLPLAKGRFFNAEAAFNVTLDNGVLIVTLADATVKGQPLPPFIMEPMKKENLAKDLYKNPEVSAQLSKFESIEVGENQIVLRLREPSPSETDAGQTDASEN